MSFPRYPKYKDSGVEWLGEVPEGWVTEKVKYFTRFVGGGTPSRDNPEYWGIDIPWVSPKDMKTEYIIDAEEHITLAGLQHSSTTLIGPGKVMVVVRSGILKHTIPVAINCTEVALNQDMKALCFDDGRCTSLFFMRWVQGLNDDLLLAWAKQGATVESIEHTYLAETIIPLPSVDEQQTIATFLDRETAKIDALVAEQENLIALLKEKRQAVISHAVTKGLDPTVPMKDSGIEWLGEVPAHWDFGPLKRFWSVTDCKHVTAEFVEEGIPLASIREVQSRWVSLDNAKNTTEYFYELLIDGGRRPIPGDLIFSRNATVGEVAQVHESHPRFAMGQDVVLLRKLASDFSSDYFQQTLRSIVAAQQLTVMMIGSTFKRINVEEIRSIKVPFPPTEEQQLISKFIDTETAKLDTLTAEAQNAIDLLKERRSALISAAVTGKIDVRGYRAQPPPII